MSKRILILPIAAVVIATLCAWKSYQSRLPHTQQSTALARSPRRQPPRFELYDEKKPQQWVRLETYLGRHTVIVVFFDGRAGADRDALLMKLREHYDRIEAAGAVVIGISGALPQENRKVIAKDGPFPFPLLSDPAYDVHRAWGRFDENRGEPLTGVFVIDRAGMAEYEAGLPKPLADPEGVIEEHLGIRHDNEHR